MKGINRRVLLMAGTMLAAQFLASAAQAAPLSIEAATDRTRLAMGEQLTLTIKISGEMAGSLPSPSPPTHDGFDIAGAPMQSSSFSWINGRVSSSKTISYILVPHVEGTFHIGESTVRYDGQEYRSAPVQVVVDAAPKPTPSSGGRDEGEMPAVSADPYSRIMVSASLAKPKVYLGEGVVYTFSFLRKVRLWDSPSYSPPAFTDFWAEDLPRNRTPREVIVKGQKYLREDIKKVLFPTREGTLSIGSTTISAQIDPFARPITLTTKPLKLEVLLLPDPPKTFSGGVGNFTIKAESDSQKGKEGEPVTVKVTIAGVGNIKAITPPRYEESESFRGYEPKDSMDISTVNDLVSGTKTFEFLFIPLAAGDLPLPVFSFTYFDPADAQFKTVSTKDLRIAVEETEGFRAVGGPSAADPVETGRLIRSLQPIRNRSKLVNWNPAVYMQGHYLAFYILPPFACLLAFFYQRGAARREKSGRGYREAMNSLKTAEKMIGGEDCRAFFAEAETALDCYLAEALKLPPAASMRDELRGELAAAACPEAMTDRIEKAYNRIDLGKFSPTRYSAEEMHRFLGEVKEIIGDCGKIGLGKGSKR